MSRITAKPTNEPPQPPGAMRFVLEQGQRKVKNSWQGLAQGCSSTPGYDIGGIFGGAFGGAGRQLISQPGTFIDNLAAAPVSMQYMALSYGYLTYGVIQTIIDEPVDDAFKGGLDITVPEFSPDDMKIFQKVLRKNRVLHQVKQGLKWARLFGGAGLIIVTDQDSSTPLDVNAINEESPLTLLPCDRWELTVPRIEVNGQQIPGTYMYYGERVDWSRIIRLKGREAPSRIRNILQGWGMSELERCMRDINSFYKLQTVIYSLIDEAKVDIIKLMDLNSHLGDAAGVQKALMRVIYANMIKGNQNALLLDKEDEFEQKTNTFSGLADLMLEARINLAGAARMPVNKLFGLAATGFASGEDAMENYNQMVESDIREPALPLIDDILALYFQKTFGYVPDFEANFHPLRIMDPAQEEQIKTSKQNRAVQLRQLDQITGMEMDEILHKDDLLDIDTEVGQGLREPAPIGESDPAAEDDPKEDKSKNATPDKKAEWIKNESRRSFRRSFARAA